MPARRRALLLVSLSLAACGARTDLPGFDLSSDAETSGAGGRGGVATAVSAGEASSAGAGGAPLCRPGDAPVELAGGMLGPQRIVVDGTYAYFTDYDAQHGRVIRVSVAGGDAVEIASLQVRPSAIAVDDLNVYWTDSLEGLVQRVPKGGGPITALAPWQHHPEDIAARPEGVYWLNRGNPNDGEIVFLAVGASEPQVLVSSQKDSAQLAVDGSEIWWTNDGSQGSLNKMAQGGSVLEMFSIIDTPRALAIDAQSVYVATAGEIWRSDRKSGPFTVIASPAVAYGMTLDDHFVYWASPFKGINKVPLRGGAVTHLADDDLARDVAVDSVCVYWTSASGHVWRAPN